MKGVRRLRHDKVAPEPASKPRRQLSINFVRDDAADGLIEETAPTVASHDEMFFHRGGVQLKVLKRLRQGKQSAEATLDLHGLTAEPARRALVEFLDACVERGLCVVHVVHGKGLRSDQRLPVLKNLVARVLPAHPHVLAYASAPRQQGGAGAINILLKRKRA